MDCFNCEGKGILGGCPVCGKEYSTSIEPTVLTELEIPNFIPKSYKDPWDKNILLNSYVEFKEDESFINYVNNLDKIVSIFSKGKLPKQSILITSGAGMGKTHMAYECLKLAKAYGYTVNNIIDNVEYRRLNNLSVDPELYKNYLKINTHLPSIEEVANCDYQIMMIDQIAFQDSHNDIISLINKRDRRGKTTMIISSPTIQQLCITDIKKNKSLTEFIYNKKMSGEKTLGFISCYLR